MRPGGIIVLDNVSQSGPRLATKLFLDGKPQTVIDELSKITYTKKP